MKKKRLLTLLGSLLLVFVMLTSTFVTTYAQQPIKLRVNLPGSPTTGHVIINTELFKKIEAACKGRVEMSFYTGSLLGPPTENYQMVKSGVVDISGCILGFFPGQFPLTEFLYLPFLGLSNAEMGSRAFWGLYEKFPELKSEFSGVKVLHLDTDAPCIIGTNKPIRKIEDLKGLKMRTLTGSPMEMMKAVGAIPVAIAPVDAYTSMERKVIDGWVWSWEGCVGHKVDELTEYFTVVSTYQPAFGNFMNLAAWNKLPPDIQKIFDQHSGDFGSAFLGKGTDHYNQIAREKIQANKNKKINTLSPEETKRWQEACKPIWDKWVANVEAKGLPGKAFFQEARKLQEKFAAEYKK